MSIVYNGTDITAINYNGTSLTEVWYDSGSGAIKVWPDISGTPILTDFTGNMVGWYVYDGGTTFVGGGWAKNRNSLSRTDYYWDNSGEEPEKIYLYNLDSNRSYIPAEMPITCQMSLSDYSVSSGGSNNHYSSQSNTHCRSDSYFYDENQISGSNILYTGDQNSGVLIDFKVLAISSDSSIEVSIPYLGFSTRNGPSSVTSIADQFTYLTPRTPYEPTSSVQVRAVMSTPVKFWVNGNLWDTSTKFTPANGINVNDIIRVVYKFPNAITVNNIKTKTGYKYLEIAGDYPSASYPDNPRTYTYPSSTIQITDVELVDVSQF